MYKIPIGRLYVLFLGLSEDQETAQFTDIEARVHLTCPGERNASIFNNNETLLSCGFYNPNRAWGV
jgi:hypothetical protein